MTSDTSATTDVPVRTWVVAVPMTAEAAPEFVAEVTRICKDGDRVNLVGDVPERNLLLIQACEANGCPHGSVTQAVPRRRWAIVGCDRCGSARRLKAREKPVIAIRQLTGLCRIARECDGTVRYVSGTG